MILILTYISHSRYKASNIRCFASTRVCKAWSPSIPGGDIPILRYLHLVSCFPFPFGLTINSHRSQTSWVWLETKLVELGMLGGHHSYEVKRSDTTILWPFHNYIQISFGDTCSTRPRLNFEIDIAQHPYLFLQYLIKPACSLCFRNGKANSINTPWRRSKLSGTIFRSCESYPRHFVPSKLSSQPPRH